MSKSPTIAAFFDMDWTLVRCNTGRLLMANLRERGEVGWLQTAHMASVFLRYRFSLIDMSRVMTDVAQQLQGMEVEPLRDRCQDLFDTMVRPLISEAALEALEGHRGRGHRIVLLSAQTQYLVEPMARWVEADAYLCTRLGDAGGRLTGSLEGPPCFGKGKTHWAREYAEANGIDLKASYFYTDSYTDLPMLRTVSHRRVVNPDPRLRWHAAVHHWPVLRFHR
jgi:HAD superfamily hydrolase (TIGR01490 family)